MLVRKRCHINTHFPELAPHTSWRKIARIDMVWKNYATVTLCVHAVTPAPYLLTYLHLNDSASFYDHWRRADRWLTLAPIISSHGDVIRSIVVDYFYILIRTRMWATAQRNGRPAEHRWRPLFNAAKFGWRPLLECRAVTLPRRKPTEIRRGAPNSRTDLRR